MVPTSPFYRHKEGRSTYMGRSKVVFFSPNWGCAVDDYCKKYTVGTEEHGARHGGFPGRHPWSCGDCAGILVVPRVSWRSLLRVPSPVLTWQSIESLAGGGLALVKARTTFEGCAHADRGIRGRGSMRSRRHSGGSSAGHVCTGSRKFPQCGHSDGDGGAVTGVGGRDSGHGCCATWCPDIV